MSEKKTQHKVLAETGRAPGSTAVRFREGGYTKTKAMAHLTHGAPLGYKSMPASADSHEHRSHQKGCGKK